MLVSRSNAVPPHDGHAVPSGTNSASGRSYQASAPWTSKTPAARSISAGVSSTCWQAWQASAGIGTPHDRWREMHQSGRLASMLWMRSSPQAGIHCTPWIASSDCARSVRPPAAADSRSMAMNHCDVARKITGLWQRQQCG